MQSVSLLYLPHPYLRQPLSQAPLGLLYLAAVVDAEVHNLSDYGTAQAILSLKEKDVFGISVTSMEIPQANRFAHLLKERFPRCKIVFGGPGVFQEAVDWTVVDSILIGEGEETFPEMLADDLKAQVYYGKRVDVNAIPMPRREALVHQGGNIFAYDQQYAKGGSTVLLTSRGCPFKCAFCAAPAINDRHVRYRKASLIRDEVKHAMDTFGIMQFRISDDMFTAKRQHVRDVCGVLGSLGVHWRISTRVKPWDEELCKMLADSGCKEVSFGVESFDDHVLEVLKKGTTKWDNIRALELSAKYGLKTRVLFMIRTPGQTKVTVSTNIYWLKRLPYDIIACTSFVPIPGSDIWHRPEEYNVEILSRNLDDYNFYFFGSSGELPLKPIIRLTDRSFDEFVKESQEFRDYLKDTGKVNKG